MLGLAFKICVSWRHNLKCMIYYIFFFSFPGHTSAYCITICQTTFLCLAEEYPIFFASMTIRLDSWKKYPKFWKQFLKGILIPFFWQWPKTYDINETVVQTCVVTLLNIIILPRHVLEKARGKHSKSWSFENSIGFTTKSVLWLNSRQARPKGIDLWPLRVMKVATNN